MPSSRRDRLLTAAQIVLAGVGVSVAAFALVRLLSIPPVPTSFEDLPTGTGAIFGTVLLVLSLGFASMAVTLPTLLGGNDSLGFNRR